MVVYYKQTCSAGLSEDTEHVIRDAIRKEPICSGKEILKINLPFIFLSDIGSLGVIKKALPDNIAYGEIRMTIAVLVVTTGFVRPKKPSAKPGNMVQKNSSFG